MRKVKPSDFVPHKVVDDRKATIPCCWPKCTGLVKEGYVACQAHWFKLPTDLRIKYRTFSDNPTVLSHVKDEISDWIKING